MHIWKEHVEIDHIMNFHEKINWQSLLYRIPLRAIQIFQLEVLNECITIKYRALNIFLMWLRSDGYLGFPSLMNSLK